MVHTLNRFRVEVIEEIKRLPKEERSKVIEFTRQLAARTEPLHSQAPVVDCVHEAPRFPAAGARALGRNHAAGGDWVRVVGERR